MCLMLHVKQWSMRHTSRHLNLITMKVIKFKWYDIVMQAISKMVPKDQSHQGRHLLYWVDLLCSCCAVLTLRAALKRRLLTFR